MVVRSIYQPFRFRTVLLARQVRFDGVSVIVAFVQGEAHLTRSPRKSSKPLVAWGIAERKSLQWFLVKRYVACTAYAFFARMKAFRKFEGELHFSLLTERTSLCFVSKFERPSIFARIYYATEFNFAPVVNVMVNDISSIVFFSNFVQRIINLCKSSTEKRYAFRYVQLDAMQLLYKSVFPAVHNLRVIRYERVGWFPLYSRKYLLLLIFF